MSLFNRLSVVSAVILAVTLFIPPAVRAADAKEINESVNEALGRFQKEVKGAKSLLAKASGVLVLPKVVKGGILLGGEYGEGALRVDGRTVGYYNVVAASWGLTFGGEMKDIVIVFLQRAALKKFQASQGWEAGVDGNVAVLEAGAGASIDTTKFKEPIVGFVVGVKGLLLDASFKGSKFSPIKK